MPQSQHVCGFFSSIISPLWVLCRGGAMAADAAEATLQTTVEGLRELLRDVVGVVRAQDITDAQLQQLLDRRFNSKRRLRLASKQHLMNAGLELGQALEVVAAFQGAFPSMQLKLPLGAVKLSPSACFRITSYACLLLSSPAAVKHGPCCCNMQQHI
jgi:hypothetical protein